MTKELRELLAKRGEQETILQGIAAQIARDDYREFTADEKARYDAAKAEVRRLKVEIDKMAAAEDEDWANRGQGTPINGWGTGTRELEPGEVRILSNKERISDLFQAETRLSMGKYMRGIVTGKWNGAADEQRAMSEGVLGGGGFVVPRPLSTRIIDLARNKARVMQAGAVTVPMTSSTLRMARVAGDPTAQWHAENQPIQDTDMTFEAVNFTARTLVALCKLSVELAEDGQGIDATIENALASALALELDRAALYGAGAGLDQPLGIFATPGVLTLDMGPDGATIQGYEPFSYAVQAIRERNGEPTGIIFAPRTYGDVERMLDGTGLPQKPFSSWDKLAKFTTAQVPINEVHGQANNASSAFVADWAQCMLGLRTDITLEVSRQAADAAGSAFGNLQVWVRAYLRADVQLAQPAHFCRIAGILPSTAEFTILPVA